MNRTECVMNQILLIQFDRCIKWRWSILFVKDIRFFGDKVRISVLIIATKNSVFSYEKITKYFHIDFEWVNFFFQIYVVKIYLCVTKKYFSSMLLPFFFSLHLYFKFIILCSMKHIWKLLLSLECFFFHATELLIVFSRKENFVSLMTKASWPFKKILL